jgi:peroxiredoxin (alkyl hydroperoxide reductase subunit C)
MLSDPGGRIGEAYGVYDEEGGVDIRGRFLIDPDGVLQAMEVLAPAVGRNVAEMVRQIRACQYVRGNPGEATPAGWEPGKKTLKPGADLVGKVCEIWAPDMAF